MSKFFKVYGRRSSEPVSREVVTRIALGRSTSAHVHECNVAETFVFPSLSLTRPIHGRSLGSSPRYTYPCAIQQKFDLENQIFTTDLVP